MKREEKIALAIIVLGWACLPVVFFILRSDYCQ
jgi:hypothetical protein